MTEPEELHSIDSWERAVRESQARAVEGRARAVRRRLHRRIAFVLFILVFATLVVGMLLIATDRV